MGYIEKGKLKGETKRERAAREIYYNLLELTEYYRSIADHSNETFDPLILNYCSGKVIKALQKDF